MRDPPALYDICVKAAVSDNVAMCRFCKKEFRSLPNSVLFDFYYALYVEKCACLLGNEFNELEILSRMLTVKHKRVKLLKSFQYLVDQSSNFPDDLIQNYGRILQSKSDNEKREAIELGIRIGSFFNEGGWYNNTIKILTLTELLCKTQKTDAALLKQLLECYQKKILAETVYCEFFAAKETFNAAQEVIAQLNELGDVPNLAGLYSNFSSMFFHRSEYDEAFRWAQKAMFLLDDKLPKLTIIEVLRQTSRACVIKRRFEQGGVLIGQAVNLASKLYDVDQHPRFSDTLLDYGFYLLNFDSIRESVKVYRRALDIRKDVFEKNNIHVALAHEDIAYALYVNEYSSGRFYTAREHAERSIRLMERILPNDHLMLASAKRVKALILEEIALDMRDGNNTILQDQFLIEAEKLHKSALDLSYTAFGEKNVQTAKHYGNLGRLYQSMKRYPEAEKMHLKAIAIKEELLGTEDYEVGLSIGHLASLYNYHMKRPKDAERLYMRSMEINYNLFGQTYSGFEYDYRGLINVYTKLNDPNNVHLYTMKMREWTVRRERIEPVELDENILPMDELLVKFKLLC